MAIISPRKRVIDTFVAKELAQASRKMLNNTDAFRALQGDFVYRNNIEVDTKTALLMVNTERIDTKKIKEY